MVTTTMEFEDVELDGKLYCIEIEASGKYVNGGIGKYEFWGRVGFDAHYGIEEFDIDKLDANEVVDGELVRVFDAAIIEKLTELVYDNKSEEVIEELEKVHIGEDEP